jgi:sugar phosphate isomerase/epimerase
MREPTFRRRTLLGGAIAMGTLAFLEGRTMAKSQGSFFQKIGVPIGLQLYTLGDEAGRDLDATFAEVAKIGYRDIELPNLYGKQAREVRAAADRAGLRISSLHVPLSTLGPTQGFSLASAPAQIADTVGALGTGRVVAPIALFPNNFRPQAGESMQAAIGHAFANAGEEPWKRTAALLNERAAALKPLNIRVGYHNHNLEFARIGQTSGWDILAKETDPQLVTFEVDVGWVVTGGLDPTTFLRKLKGRVTQLHVKDVARSNTTNYVLSMQPAEVGSGALDWGPILTAAYDAGVRHFYVEQEPPFSIPRMEAARRSYAFLAQLRA